MPKLDGYEAARAIRQAMRAGGRAADRADRLGGDEDRARSKQAGFDHHLVKPVVAEELLGLVSSLARSMPATANAGDRPAASLNRGMTMPPDPVDSKPKILVVDDNADFAEILAVLLTQHGHPATAADGAERALDKLDEDAAIGVVITDLRMPGVDGMDFRRVVRYRFPNMPVLLMTGMPLDLDDPPPADAVVLQKPFSFQAVIAALTRLQVTIAARRDDAGRRESGRFKRDSGCRPNGSRAPSIPRSRDRPAHRARACGRRCRRRPTSVGTRRASRVRGVRRRGRSSGTPAGPP